MNIEMSSENDIFFKDGELPMVTGTDEMVQLIAQVLKSSQGDWFLDYDVGLPFFQTILQKATSIADIEGIYIDRILDIPGVLNLTTFDMDYDEKNRDINLIFTVRTTDGEINFNLAEA